MPEKKKIATIFGTRPEIIKMSRLIPMLDKAFEHTFLFTSQHFSRNMAEIFFKELRVRGPDKFLDVRSSDYDALTSAVEKELRKIKPEYVVVYGDTNSTLSSARAAKNIGAKIIHIEAGLRSYDPKMPEERNRFETDHLSDYLFVPTELCRRILTSEGIKKNVFVVGNTIVDACLHYAKKAKKCKEKDYILLTAHRQENVDDPSNILKMMKMLEGFPKVIFPAHPRTEKKIRENKIVLPPNVRMVKAVGYLEFLGMLKGASVVITDSGGVQEEAITLKTPCLTIRAYTERWETIIEGGNFLVGLQPDVVKSYVKAIRETELGNRMRMAKNPYGDGKTSQKIMAILKKAL